MPTRLVVVLTPPCSHTQTFPIDYSPLRLGRFDFGCTVLVCFLVRCWFGCGSALGCHLDFSIYLPLHYTDTFYFPLDVHHDSYVYTHRLRTYHTVWTLRWLHTHFAVGFAAPHGSCVFAFTRVVDHIYGYVCLLFVLIYLSVAVTRYRLLLLIIVSSLTVTFVYPGFTDVCCRSVWFTFPVYVYYPHLCYQYTLLVYTRLDCGHFGLRYDLLCRFAVGCCTFPAVAPLPRSARLPPFPHAHVYYNVPRYTPTRFRVALLRCHLPHGLFFHRLHCWFAMRLPPPDSNLVDAVPFTVPWLPVPYRCLYSRSDLPCHCPARITAGILLFRIEPCRQLRQPAALFQLW